MRTGRRRAARDRHAQHVLELAEAAAPQLEGPDQVAWAQRLEAERDNVRAALGWLAERGAVEPGLRLANALLWFWFNRGYWTEGWVWLERFLALAAVGDAPAGDPGDSDGRFGAGVASQRARALFGAGFLAAYRENRWGTAARDALRGEPRLGAAAGRCPDRRLGAVRPRRERVRPRPARSPAVRFEQSLACFREAADHWGIDLALQWLGAAAAWQGDHATARRHYQAARAAARERGNRMGIARALLGLGDVAARMGDLREARRLLEQSLAIRDEGGTGRRRGG